MLTIEPVTEEKAEEDVAKIYSDIKRQLGVASVPLLFQYIANYKEYLQEIWENISQNTKEVVYKDAVQAGEVLSQNAIDVIYTTSQEMKEFLSSLSEDKKKEIFQTTHSLLRTNIILLIVSLAMREGIKGLALNDQQEIPSTIESHKFTVGRRSGEHALINEISLASLTSGQTKYKDIFTLLEEDMDRLAKTEAYLVTRVELERMCLSYIRKFPHRISMSYWKIARLLDDQKHFPELIYLLRMYFPTRLPAFVLTSAALQKAVKEEL
jgi:hypothetical protein